MTQKIHNGPSKKYVQHPSPRPLPFLPLSLTQTSSTPIWNACMSQLHKEALYAHPINTNKKSRTSNPQPQRHMKRKHGHRTIFPNLGDMEERKKPPAINISQPWESGLSHHMQTFLHPSPPSLCTSSTNLQLLLLMQPVTFAHSNVLLQLFL